MTDSEKPEADFSETEAVETDEEDRPRVRMERLHRVATFALIIGIVTIVADGLLALDSVTNNVLLLGGAVIAIVWPLLRKTI